MNERVTISLVPKSVTDLEYLQQELGFSKTDLMNRALAVYRLLIESGQSADVLLRDRTTGEIERILLL